LPAARRRQKCSSSWPGVCSYEGMSAIVFKVNRRSGAYITTAVVPGNHSEEVRLGLADGVIVAIFLTCIGGLICLLAAG
jgi:hypothetical protein